jgi:hypothetical protein
MGPAAYNLEPISNISKFTGAPPFYICAVLGTGALETGFRAILGFLATFYS